MEEQPQIKVEENNNLNRKTYKKKTLRRLKLDPPEEVLDNPENDPVVQKPENLYKSILFDITSNRSITFDKLKKSNNNKIYYSLSNTKQPKIKRINIIKKDNNDTNNIGNTKNENKEKIEYENKKNNNDLDENFSIQDDFEDRINDKENYKKYILDNNNETKNKNIINKK